MYFQYRNEKSDIKLNPIKYYVMQWHMQLGHITTNLKVKIYFTLPELRTKNCDVEFSCG